MDLHWQPIKFLRAIYIDWFIHRIEGIVNKCTLVRARDRGPGPGPWVRAPFRPSEYHRLRLNRRKKRNGPQRGKRNEGIRGSDGPRGVVISARIARVPNLSDRVRMGKCVREDDKKRKRERESYNESY